jgi:mitochondrial fission protein ELM1
MAHAIEDAIGLAGGSLMMTFSRRTPDKARALLTARLRHLPGLIWDGTGENPYFAFLGAADHILVTEDSTNMATEAASTGKPVFILKMDGSSLEGLGATRPFDGLLRGWSYEPVRETQRAAAVILERLAAPRS